VIRDAGAAARPGLTKVSAWRTAAAGRPLDLDRAHPGGATSVARRGACDSMVPALPRCMVGSATLESYLRIASAPESNSRGETGNDPQ
jgi:hypothetical protein